MSEAGETIRMPSDWPLFDEQWLGDDELDMSYGQLRCVLEKRPNGRLSLVFADTGDILGLSLEPEDMVLTLEALLEAARSTLPEKQPQ